MSSKTLRCLVDIDIKSITSPGTWLPKHEDIYLSINLFGQERRTRLVGCVFPLVFNDHFRFDKVFHTAHEPSQVTEALLGDTVRINLVQTSEMFSDGRLLAYYESSARNFLYPYQSHSSTYSIRDREVLLERTVAFPGINPRLEFSTKTIIEDATGSAPYNAQMDINHELDYGVAGQPERRSRSRIRTRSLSRTPTYGRSTVSSAHRYRSPSPTYGRSTISSARHYRPPSPTRPLSSQMRYLGFDDNYDDLMNSVENRPPFVVRRVERDLIERRPSTRQDYGMYGDGFYKKYVPPGTTATYNMDPTRLYRPSSPGLRKFIDTRPAYSSNYDRTGFMYSEPAYDSEYRYRRSPSPTRYLSSIRYKYDSQFDDRCLSPERSDRMHMHNGQGLRRNRSFERLDRGNTFNGYSQRYQW